MKRRSSNAALTIIEQTGVGALTMRELSDRLGVSLGATYKHVPNKDALIQLAAQELFARVEQTALPDDDWIIRMRIILAEFYCALGRYPV